MGNNHFEILELPPPVLDDLDRALWTVQKSEIKKQYFKISRQVHPDRHMGNETESKRAANAFDIVQQAFHTLHDNIKREQYVNAYGDKLKYKASKSKFEIAANDVKKSNTKMILSLDEQDEELKASQRKRMRRKK